MSDDSRDQEVVADVGTESIEESIIKAVFLNKRLDKFFERLESDQCRERLRQVAAQAVKDALEEELPPAVTERIGQTVEQAVRDALAQEMPAAMTKHTDEAQRRQWGCVTTTAAWIAVAAALFLLPKFARVLLRSDTQR